MYLLYLFSLMLKENCPRSNTKTKIYRVLSLLWLFFASRTLQKNYYYQHRGKKSTGSCFCSFFKLRNYSKDFSVKIFQKAAIDYGTKNNNNRRTPLVPASFVPKIFLILLSWSRPWHCKWKKQNQAEFQSFYHSVDQSFEHTFQSHDDVYTDDLL